ncbi:MAG: ABC transporter ATP-binding protein [Mycobacteriales bacterium]
MSPAATAVRLAGLSKRYGAVDVLRDLTLDVTPGSLVALLGPSGCGKTTTLRAVAGLIDPTAGDVLFDGRSVLAQPPERRPVAMVFQAPLLFPHVSVGDNVAFGLRMRGVRRAERRRQAEQALDRVQLGGFAGRRPSELSGGQEQRVALARALVVEPSVLLLDEPFSALDASLRTEMRDLVRQLQRDLGVTTLFVTHDQEEAVVLADRVALMLEGRLQQYAAPEAFYAAPASLAVARFFGAANAFPGTVTGGRHVSALGEVVVRDGSPDGPCILVVRQEAVNLTGPYERDVLPGRVQTAVFLGTAVRVEITLAAGPVITAVVPPSERIAVGDEVGVRLPHGGCSVVTDES